MLIVDMEETATPEPAITERQAHLLALLEANEPLRGLARLFRGALYALSHQENPDHVSQAAHSMRELFDTFPKAYGLDYSKFDRKTFETTREEIATIVELARKGEAWGELTSDNAKRLYGLLDKYLKLNQKVTRSKLTAEAITATNPFFHLTSKARQKALKEEFRKASETFQAYAHHGKDERNALIEEIGKGEVLLLGVLQPPPTQALEAIRELVKKSPGEVDAGQLDRVFEHFKKRDELYEFFFRHLNDPRWVAELKRRGFFQTPPNLIWEGDGYRLPIWLPMEFLVQVAGAAAGDVVAICVDLAATDNPRVFEQVARIATRVPVEQSVKLKDKLREGVNLKAQVLGDHYGDVLIHWATKQEGFSSALELARELVRFRPDPRQEEKAREDEGPLGILKQLAPQPKLDSWPYHRVLIGGVAHLAKMDPYAVVEMLVAAVDEFLGLKYADRTEEDRKGGDDYSEYWCRRIDAQSDGFIEPDEALVQALTNACDEACKLDDPEVAQTVDQMLRDRHWKIFQRVRHHLHGTFPKLFRTQVRELILGYPFEEEDIFPRETVEAIRGITESPEEPILSPEEMEQVGIRILEKPDREEQQRARGVQFNDEHFELARNYYHRQQLWPFASLLKGSLLKRFQEVQMKVTEPPSVDTYEPRPQEEAKIGSHQSPKKPDELSSFSDDELIAFLNDWNDRKLDPAAWWIEIDHTGLAEAFKVCLRQNPARFFAWNDRWKEIVRPIFVEAAMGVAGELVQKGDFSIIPAALALGDFLLTKKDPEEPAARHRSPASATVPYWNGARRYVIEFFDLCTANTTNLPERYAEALCDSIKRAALEPGLLDNRGEILSGRNFENLLHLVVWGRHFGRGSATDLKVWAMAKDVLLRRLDGEPLLTISEQEHLAMFFGMMLFQDNAWARSIIPKLFPREKPVTWRRAFASQIRRQQTNGAIFDALADEFRYAIDHPELLRENENKDLERESTVGVLGVRLLFLYLGNKFPLAGPDSLLEAAYQKMTFKERAYVLRTAGVFLIRTETLDETIRVRACAFFDSRLNSAEQSHEAIASTEFDGLANWFAAKGLDARWRGTRLRRVLALGKYVNHAMSLTQSIRELLPAGEKEAVEAFAIIAKWAEEPSFYISADDGKAILATGDKSSDKIVREVAREAREALLHAKLFQYESAS